MNRKYHLYIISISLLFCSQITPGNENKASGEFRLKSTTIDAGGGVSSNSSYQLTSTIGQFESNISGGGRFRISSGFWPQLATPTDVIFADSFE